MSIREVPTPKSQGPNPKEGPHPEAARPNHHVGMPGSLRRLCARLGFGIWVLGFGLCLASSACAKAQAKAVAEGPPLAVPEPPPRVLVPPDEPLAEAPPPEETPPAPAPRPPARPTPRRPSATTTPTESEPRAETPAPAPPAPAPATVEPPRELRPLTSAGDPAEERKVRDVLQHASRDLSKVDYRRLSNEGKSQYEQSKRFNDQAEQAIKDRNYVFAATLADKAAALAAQLLNR